MRKKLTLRTISIYIFAAIVIGLIVFLFLPRSTKTKYDKEANEKLLNATHKSYTQVSYPTNKSYKDRTFYEIFVASFNDSNGDGLGDLKGVEQKLDYLKDLGISGIWLMPINESPSYHGYDVSDYYNVRKKYGTMDDLYSLINEAHKRDIAVYMDLVINHTSTKNPWFMESLNNKDSKYRDYYLWTQYSNKLNEYSSINTMPWRVASKDNIYYGIFAEDMPDLNYDNPDVRKEVKDIAKYYLDMGMDGFRLDAARHIYDGELDKNLKWWKEFNSYVKSVNKNALLVGEVWDKTEVVSDYLTALDSCFNFDLSTDIVNSVKDNNFKDLASSYFSMQSVAQSKNKDYLDSTFLGNHDMNRIMSTLGSVDKCKTAAAILLTLPGTPYIYYGEETGMTGVKPDEKIREPFIWDNKDKSKNTSWTAVSNDNKSIAVKLEEKNKDSLLNFYKGLIKLRNDNPTLRYGSFEALNTGNSKVFTFTRSYKDENISVFINGNDEDQTISLSPIKGEILYSSQGSSGNVDISKELKLKKGEILIIKNVK
ncbi:alpha-amylase family glycosyl hydrolase [Clostridium folliculivorans]|uniref:Alpha-amylase n=1 Tax=Clostridium folliculivorans TaxID=2886038 RepID=A0A9W5Y4X7_9CLOT|nr:alpha-amylase family glycosyl hydrolase [Clostridium folliculivorans]GKU26650.1 alpha-amylase [Clostridium folliculivorans]GKU28918.1 alpha-amylase [Clostridium folliculivorans]